MTMRKLILIAALLSLSACAGEAPWTSPDANRKQTEKDYSSCRRYADSQTGSGAGGGYFDDERSSDPRNMADRSVSKKEYAGIIDYCMRAKGYFPKK